MQSMRLHTTNAIVGRHAQSNDDMQLGRIEQVGVEPESGVVLFALVVPYVGYDRLIPVPWELVHLTADGSSAVVDATQEKLLKAPTIERRALSSWVEEPQLSRIREYYGLAPEPTTGFREAAIPVHPRPQPRRGSGGAWALGLLVLLIVAGVAAFVLYDQGVSVSSASVKAAAGSVKDASVDAATTVKVKVALALSKSVSAYDISVDTHDGVVTLKGAVPSDEIRGLASEIAADTSGVASVDNRLSVDPQVQAKEGGQSNEEPARNQDLKAAVEQSLRQSRVLAGSIILVRVTEGRVVLEGLVRDSQQRVAAEEAARRVQGVQEVMNNLKVVEHAPAGPESEKTLTVQAFQKNHRG